MTSAAATAEAEALLNDLETHTHSTGTQKTHLHRFGSIADASARKAVGGARGQSTSLGRVPEMTSRPVTISSSRTTTTLPGATKYLTEPEPEAEPILDDEIIENSWKDLLQVAVDAVKKCSNCGRSS